VPATSYRLNREDMTMKMLGVAQKLPWPGKRALRQEVAAKEAQSVEHGYRETVNRVVREVKMAYLDLALATESIRLLRENRLVLEQFLRIAESRYSLGQSPQADVFKAQTQLGKMSEEILRMEREVPTLEAELAKLAGRGGKAQRVAAPLPMLNNAGLSFDALQAAALRQRPQLHGLRAMLERGNSMVELARKDYRPDFDVRLSYGQRDNMLDGTRRPDMVSLTVAINLPVWRRNKLDPRIAEAHAMLSRDFDAVVVGSKVEGASLQAAVGLAAPDGPLSSRPAPRFGRDRRRSPRFSGAVSRRQTPRRTTRPPRRAACPTTWRPPGRPCSKLPPARRWRRRLGAVAARSPKDRRRHRGRAGNRTPARPCQAQPRRQTASGDCAATRVRNLVQPREFLQRVVFLSRMERTGPTSGRTRS